MKLKESPQRKKEKEKESSKRKVVYPRGCISSWGKGKVKGKGRRGTWMVGEKKERKKRCCTWVVREKRKKEKKKKK